MRNLTIIIMKKHKTIKLLTVLGLLAGGISVNAEPTQDVVGPYVGTLKATEAYLLYSPGKEEQTLRLTVMGKDGKEVTSTESVNKADNDFVAKFAVTGLTAGNKYTYKIESIKDGKATVVAGNTENNFFNTVSKERKGQVFTAGFLSCANDSTDAVWKEMLNHDLDMLCFGGDTPYIDTGDFTVMRKKHRHFMKRPDLAKIGRNTPILGTWDDHDFGRNNGNGVSNAAWKNNTMRAFKEYRAQEKFGNGTNGIYQKADMGAMEVFLLDARWWSQTGASPVDENQSTCFGNDQWEWLLKGIRESKAPFKILLQGQIWQDKKGGETDDMHTYYAERDALLDIIKKEKIPGVILVGGDIHYSRYLTHKQRVGYDLHDFIISPGHTGIIKSLNVYHQDLDWSGGKKNQFLTLKVDTTKEVPELTAKFLDKTGMVNMEKVITYDQLTPVESKGLDKDLRAYWSFDKDAKNASILGDRENGELIGGASITQNGYRGGALKVARVAGQYVSVPRSMLDDNASAYTASSWVKASTLPKHGSKDRYFIMESKVNNHCKLPKASTSGYGISVGIEASSDPLKVNLQLFTETLESKAVSSQKSPTNKTQGGYDFLVDRSLLKDWTNVAVTFDSKQLQLFVNGKLVKTHALDVAGPIAEVGGLVIGGHRAGEGRNFDGMIDEVAIWNRVLSNEEILLAAKQGIALVK